MPDPRKPGPNTRYRIPDAALGAFGISVTQSPPFLEYQRHLQQAKGQNNASPLYIHYAAKEQPTLGELAE